MNDSAESPAMAPGRRAVIKTGAGALAALAGLGMVKAAAHAQGTPEAAACGDLEGMYAVTRSFALKEEANIDELTAIVEGFVDIVSTTPGFISYNVVIDEEARGLMAISIFDNAESAEASTAAAADYIAEHNLSDYYVDTTPVILQGKIAVSAAS